MRVAPDIHFGPTRRVGLGSSLSLITTGIHMSCNCCQSLMT